MLYWLLWWPFSLHYWGNVDCCSTRRAGQCRTWTTTSRTAWRSCRRLPSKTWAFRRPLPHQPFYPAPTPTIPSTRPQRDLRVPHATAPPTPTNAAASTRLTASWSTTPTPRTYPRHLRGRVVRGTRVTPADTTTPSTTAAVAPSLGCRRFRPLIWRRLYHPPTSHRRHQTTATPKTCRGSYVHILCLVHYFVFFLWIIGFIEVKSLATHRKASVDFIFMICCDAYLWSNKIKP